MSTVPYRFDHHQSWNANKQRLPYSNDDRGTVSVVPEKQSHVQKSLSKVLAQPYKSWHFAWPEKSLLANLSPMLSPVPTTYDPCNVLQLVPMPSENDIATRAAICALKSAFGGKSTSAVAEVTGIPARTINAIFARAIERGFDPTMATFAINNTYVEDAPRAGRPKKQIQELQERITTKVRSDRCGREASCAYLAGYASTDTINVSATTVWRTLKEAGFKKTKPIRKPGLT